MAREFYDEETNELLTDLSEIPKKQLSKKQRENKRTAKREGYVDKDLDGKPDKDTFNIEDTDAVYGFWIDSGSMYIDMSLNVFNLEDAMQVAKSTNQIAIWDCNLNESIIL